jgi:hypothetical protein
MSLEKHHREETNSYSIDSLTGRRVSSWCYINNNCGHPGEGVNLITNNADLSRTTTTAASPKAAVELECHYSPN